MERVLVFIDEVEETASDRAHGAGVGVVNELLKSIVTFRERDQRLLVCATNSIGSLDPAFLRHGRFDYVLPIGPPDDDARRAMWERAVGTAGSNLDIEQLVRASAGLTPADIEHACQQAAAASFDQTVASGTRSPAGTDDYLAALADTRPTLDAALVRRSVETSSGTSAPERSPQLPQLPRQLRTACSRAHGAPGCGLNGGGTACAARRRCGRRLGLPGYRCTAGSRARDS